MSKLIRKSWPKIRLVNIKGQPFFRVDARKTGTSGRQETFKSQKEAERRAAAIAAHFNSNGSEGLSFPAELHGAALTADKLLRPYGKTLLQAAEHYVAHLEVEKQRKDSALVPLLAQKWFDHKAGGKTKKLRPLTLKGINEAAEILKTVFVGKGVLEVSAVDINQYLDGLKVGLRRKFNLRGRLSQFFNWCVAQGHSKANPCEKIEIHVASTYNVSIFTPSDALRLMTICRETVGHEDLVLYHAISLFAGLRPGECQLLQWENVHLEEKIITVLGATSKTKETRNIPIETNLLAWFKEFPSSKAKGFVTPQDNLTARLQAVHTTMGYKVGNLNPEAKTWPQDVMRHSYGSYWLEKNKQRAVLAEHMGNSLQIIKKHYKKVVSNAAWKEFWSITPTYDGSGEIGRQPSEEIARNRGKRLAAAMAED